MKKTRGLGFVYQHVYSDKRTGEQKKTSTWWIQYFVRGERYRESSGSSTRADAVNLLKQRVGQAAQGRIVAPRAEKTTFEQLAQMLIDDYEANERKSRKRIRFSLAHLREFFGQALEIEITSDRVTSYITYRQRKGAAAAAINRELAALKRAFSLGEKAGKVIQRPAITKLRENNRRKGFFEPDQYPLCWSTCPKSSSP